MAENTTGRPYKYKSVEEFVNKWNEYLEHINGAAPRMRQFALFADISMQCLDEYKHREGFGEPIRKMLATCEDALEAMLHDNNRKNIVGPIFALKNNFGWKDKQEVDANILGNLQFKWEDSSNTNGSE